jgi:ATP-binding cassette subfamily B protein/subfamily B ATP-binding cassette protein MsbA
MKKQLRLLRYARPHRRSLAVVVAIMLTSIGLHVLRPWPLKFLLDDVLVRREVPAWFPAGAGLEGLILAACVATVVLVLAATLLDMVSTMVSVTFGQRMVYDLGADLFAHLQQLSVLYHSRQPTGDTVSRVTGDAYCVHILINSVLLPLLQALLTLVTMFAIMWCIEPTMTLLSLGVVPLLFLMMYLFSRPMERRGRIERDLEGRLMSQVEQTLSAMPAVQAFTREQQEQVQFRQNAGEAVLALRRSAAVDMAFKLCIGVVTAVGAAVIMWLGAHYALEGQVSLGTIIVFLSYLESLYEPLNAIAHLGSTMQHAGGSAGRVLEVLDTPPDVKDSPGAVAFPLRGHVRYENVSFGYEAGRAVVKAITLEARPGEVVAIVGPTGAGKTTLVNLLIRFFDPWSGRVTIDGRDVREYQLQALRRQVAVVLQDPFIFPISMANNISFGRPDASRGQIEAAARAASADDFIRRVPGGYDAVAGERGTTLSGGEKQRLSIARAFLKDAPILVLDEPTSALDARTEGMLLEALRRLMKGRTTFIIAHRLSTIRNADRILVLDKGAIIEEGRHSELLARGGLYAGLYRQQMKFVRHDVEPELSVTTQQEDGS